MPARSTATDVALMVRCSLCETTDANRLEPLIAGAYVHLALVPLDQDGARIMTLARFGHHEVRLVEFARVRDADEALFWLELYDRDAHVGIDACSCHDLEEAARGLAHFICRARALISELPMTICKSQH